MQPQYLLLAHPELRRYPARFDVVAISAAPAHRIDWIRSAFTLRDAREHRRSQLPYCGETITLLLDLSVEAQSYIEDCSVCCQPMTVSYACRRWRARGAQRRGCRLDVASACGSRSCW